MTCNLADGWIFEVASAWDSCNLDIHQVFEEATHTVIPT